MMDRMSSRPVERKPTDDLWRNQDQLQYFRASPEERRAEDPVVVFWQSAYEDVIRHLSSDTSRELGGLLLGTYDANRNVSRIEEIIPATRFHSTRTSLTFEQECWAEFDRIQDKLRESGSMYDRMGWYHSHPGLGIFLSSYDLDVCTNFRLPHQVALVVDPI